MKMDIFQNRSAPLTEVGGPGALLVAAAVAAELAEIATPVQARGFLVAVGSRIAATEPLDGVSDAVELSVRVNALGHRLGWGEAEIALEADAIVVTHRHLPAPSADDRDDPWRLALPALLEGAYAGWFRALGSGPALSTTATWVGNAIVLRHGR